MTYITKPKHVAAALLSTERDEDGCLFISLWYKTAKTYWCVDELCQHAEDSTSDIHYRFGRNEHKANKH